MRRGRPHAPLFGFSAGGLAAWSVYDAILAVGLLRASRKPEPRLLGVLAGAATFDAALSVIHLAQVGPGPTWLSALVRVAAAAAPLAGAVGLWWARRRAAVTSRAP